MFNEAEGMKPLQEDVRRNADLLLCRAETSQLEMGRESIFICMALQL